MAPLILQGINLGERHKYFNSKVNDAVKKEIPFETILSETSDSDIDQLFKIYIASKYRNVDFIIEMFKSEDMLYVSCAIKKSKWLITEKEYATIINCQHLHEDLFPNMTSKAISKLLLSIRLNLNDNKRGDEFFAHYEAIELKSAIKWLPNCSLEVVKRVINKNFDLIEPHLFKKLYEKYPEVFNICANKNKTHYIKNHLEAVVFILNTDTEKYLNTFETGEHWNVKHKLNKKHTRTIMKKCPARIINKFEMYNDYIDIDSFAKYMKPDKIKDFLLTISKKKEIKYWLTFQRIRPLLKYMPKDGKFEFLKDVFITKSYRNSSDDSCLLSLGEVVKSEHLYQWYNYAPFDIAFTDLKKIMKTESVPEERAGIMRTMLAAAGRNISNILKVMNYYKEKHINEPYKFKINFINYFLTVSNTHQFDESSWKILDELFHSCEVYMETKNNVQHCVEVILVYKLLHGQTVPEQIEKKFKFNTLKKIKNKLNNEEKEVVFSYLLNFMEKKIKNQNTDNIDSVNELVVMICNVLELLSDWNKNLSHYSNILNKIKEIALLKHDQPLAVNLNDIYKKKKCWMKNMFEESLLLSDSQNVYINVLKHDTSLLQKYPKQVKAVQRNDTVILRQFLSKLKIYWNESLAVEWANAYRSQINESNGYKALTLGLCGILPRQELLKLFDEYAPMDSKIDWNEIDEHLFSLRKSFAQLMYMSRPQPPISSILRYTHGDYMQYALPSLNSIFYNNPPQKLRSSLPEVIKGSVSLQKHGIRNAFNKLKCDELKDIFTNIWKSSTNISIRAVIFQLTFNLLCKEKSQTKTNELWEILQTFIDNLSDEENPLIYKLLSEVKDVPKHLQGKFCIKSYKFLKNLPSKANCQSNIEQILKSIPELFDNIDENFVEEILLEFIEKEYFKKVISSGHHYLCWYKEILGKYLLCASESEQERRFDKVIKPWLAQVFSLWTHINQSRERETEKYFKDWINVTINTTRHNLVNKKYDNPSKIFKKVLNEIETKLEREYNYYASVAFRVLIAFTEIYEQIKSELVEAGDENESTEEFNQRCYDMWDKMAPSLAFRVTEMVKDDMEKLFPSVWAIFVKYASEICTTLSNNNDSLNGNFIFERELLKNEDFPLAALMALKTLPHNMWNAEKDKKIDQVKILFTKHPSLEVRMHYYKKYDESSVVPLDNCEEIHSE